MGSINIIYKPKYWIIEKEGRSKICENDIIYYMKVGECEDYGYCDIDIFISKINFENIINGKYLIKVESYSEEVIKLFDENGKRIPLIKGYGKEKDKMLERNIKKV